MRYSDKLNKAPSQAFTLLVGDADGTNVGGMVVGGGTEAIKPPIVSVPLLSFDSSLDPADAYMHDA